MSFAQLRKQTSQERWWSSSAITAWTLDTADAAEEHIMGALRWELQLLEARYELLEAETMQQVDDERSAVDHPFGCITVTVERTVSLTTSDSLPALANDGLPVHAFTTYLEHYFTPEDEEDQVFFSPISSMSRVYAKAGPSEQPAPGPSRRPSHTPRPPQPALRPPFKLQPVPQSAKRGLLRPNASAAAAPAASRAVCAQLPAAPEALRIPSKSSVTMQGIRKLLSSRQLPRDGTSSSSPSEPSLADNRTRRFGRKAISQSAASKWWSMHTQMYSDAK